jgi:glutathione S-transferase
MKLYFSPGACSLAVHIVFRETKLPFTLVRVELPTHKTETGIDYYTINPKGAVPLLELDNGKRLSEGPIIAQYLCDQAGRHDLMPAAGEPKRYRVMEWQNYITAEIHKGFSPLFNPAFDAATKDIIRAQVKKKLGWISQQLREKQYLTGDTFTAADAYLFVCSQWAKRVNLDLSDLPELQGLLARIAARPAVQEALKAEGLIN